MTKRKAPREQFLYRYYLSSEDGDTETLTLVWAGSDEEAMDKGWAALPSTMKKRINRELRAAEDEEIFLTCEDLSDDPDVGFRLENALQDIPALCALFHDKSTPQADKALEAVIAALVPLATPTLP